jgi:hypothetical protein
MCKIVPKNIIIIIYTYIIDFQLYIIYLIFGNFFIDNIMFTKNILNQYLNMKL